jgi:hypothetical protein
MECLTSESLDCEAVASVVCPMLVEQGKNSSAGGSITLPALPQQKRSDHFSDLVGVQRRD